MRRVVLVATLLLAGSLHAQEDVPRSPRLIPEGGCSLTGQECLNAARRITSCEVTRDELKKELQSAPNSRALLALGFVAGVIVAGAAAYYVVTR